MPKLDHSAADEIDKRKLHRPAALVRVEGVASGSPKKTKKVKAAHIKGRQKKARIKPAQKVGLP
ncbi:MAG: hypothetical protein R3B54_17050 [Bdellovibrionota bacterium]